MSVHNIRTKAKQYTENHKAYELALNCHDFYPVIGYGSAGTGKTYTAIKHALKQLEKKSIKQIVCIRPNVSFSKESGHLPGSEREKLLPWIRPILQSMNQLGYNDDTIAYMEKTGKLVFYPLESIQGLTFDNAFILVDECQNISYEQLRVLLTRQGAWSRMVLAGDVAQISPKFHNSGLSQLLDMIRIMCMEVHTINFTRADILRGKQCKKWLVGFEEYDVLLGN